MKNFCSIAMILFGVASVGMAQPTITGVNAFWWLGSGILSDGGTCSGQTGPCYYAQAAWTANANGAMGTPTWHVNTVPGGGSVSLSCNTCTNTTATSTAPSNGCTYDITVYVTYPDGSQSGNFNVAIITPKNTTLLSGYPTDASCGLQCYLSTTAWNLTDTCGSSDAGLDLNETFGTWTNDYVGNTWGLPTAGSTYRPNSTLYDYMSPGCCTPVPQPPQSPLGSTKVFHDYPYTLWVGTQTFGHGVSVLVDTQQFYQDHGRHQ